jgi:hypothetical protein
VRRRLFFLLACAGLATCMSLIAYHAPPGCAAPAVTETPTPALGWEGHIVSNTPWATNGAGSILRVHVVERPGVTIEVTYYDQKITGVSGSKAEYGPYAAEFAPLPRGTYTVSVPELDASLEIWVDGYNLLVVEFTQTRRLDATPTPTIGYGPTPSPTPTPEPNWEGQLLGVTNKYMAGSLLWVKVAGRQGQKVTVSTLGGFTVTALTGAKEELGDDVAEFAALSSGTYTIAPWGLDTTLTVDLDGSNIWSVEFRPVSGARTPTLTPVPNPTFASSRVIGSGARPYSPISATITTTPGPPSLVPTPQYAWQGQILRREPPPQGTYLGSIAVQVVAVKGITVQLTSGGWHMEGVTGSKPEHGDYAVEFGGLPGGTYYASVPDLAAGPTPVELPAGGFALLQFSYGLVPPTTPTPTPVHGTWTGGVTSNTSGTEPAGGVWSNIIVKVGDRKGLTVRLHADGFDTTCVTGTKPEYGEGACEFGGLWPGTYRVTPEGLGPSVTLFMDGRGTAMVEFWIQ